MDVLRKNTDYALRMMANLANHHRQGPISVKVLAKEEEVSHQFACKILQQLHEAGLVESVMGPAGGYQLCRKPQQVTLLDIVRAMQGNITINHCTDGNDTCPRQSGCKVNDNLRQLQQIMDGFLADVTLQNLL